MALTAAGWRENKLRKVYFFTVIRQGYKTLVSKKQNHNTNGRKVLRELAQPTSQ